jgi:hypothetical protein
VSGRRIIIAVISICLLIGTLAFCFFAMPALMGVFMLSLIKNVAESDFKIEPSPGLFHVQVLEVTSKPEKFTERIRIQCAGDMKVEIGAYDMKKFGIFRAEGTNGEQFYREGKPQEVMDLEPVRAQGDSSSCVVALKLQFGPDGVHWHNEINVNGSSSTMDTTFPSKMEISGIQTNWPGAYEKGSALPLASLGDDKILLFVR